MSMQSVKGWLQCCRKHASMPSFEEQNKPVTIAYPCDRSCNCRVQLFSSYCLESWHVHPPSLLHMQVNDRRGGAQTQAELSVVASSTIGIYAYAASSELFNTALLNGQAVQTIVQAFL